jgi:uncharacterized NAD(P)/FAD-binding protein YdhS
MRAEAAVIGGGFSGTMAAVQLLRQGAQSVVLVEARGRVASGVAYSTNEPFHLLNVPAKSMSAFPDQPAHFAEWLQRNHGLGPDEFAPRRLFRAYLHQVLDEARDERLTIVDGEAAALHREEEGLAIELSDGRRIECRAAVLTGGNLPSRRPPLRAEAERQGLPYIADPWAPEAREALAVAAAQREDVLILGTGLTMVDMCLTLDALGLQGRILATSRRGLLPQVHQAYEPAPMEAPEANLRALVRQTRERARAHGWRAAIDALRPHTVALAKAMPLADWRRFVTHVRPYWDVHRHRIAPAIGVRLEQLRAGGRLEVVPGRGRLEGGEIAIERRGGGGIVRRRIGAIVNCTGPGRDILDTEDPLIPQLLESGIARPDAIGMGLDVDDESRVVAADGAAHPDIFAIGPLSRGRFWEVVAVPDIRGQAASVAAQLLRSHRL